MNMQVEFNEKFKVADDAIQFGNGVVMITPPINSGYWILRVHLYKDQYLLAFPKFFTIGIGFALEEDWNTNLPYSTDAERIFNHIAHNRKYKQITKKQVIAAINELKPHCERILNQN